MMQTTASARPLPTSWSKRESLISCIWLLAVAFTWLMAFYYAPIDGNQGPIYRIIFIHVPSAFAAFFLSFGLFIFSIWALRNGAQKAEFAARACAEVGLVATVLTLATGSIWGRPTWGVWWTWDARLTTTFLLALLFSAYLLLYQNITEARSRRRICAVFGILIFVDVPIIYKSVTWWRTLHQPPSMMRPGGPSMDPAIFYTLLMCITATCLYAMWIGILRYRNLALKQAIESESLDILRAHEGA